MKYNFLYADYSVGEKDLAVYKIGELIHDDGGTVASSFRGGMLHECNLRILFINSVDGGFRLQNQDYRMQGLYIYELSYYFMVLDVFECNQFTQILLTPSKFSDEEASDIISEARKDFRQLLSSRPVGVLDTLEWRRRLGKPVGRNGKKVIYTSA